MPFIIQSTLTAFLSPNGGWDQGNTSFLFESDAWGNKVVDLFNEPKAWALQNEPQYQINP